jgi:hypothetical protein
MTKVLSLNFSPITRYCALYTKTIIVSRIFVPSVMLTGYSSLEEKIA